jgi:hypothetical protein
MGNETSALLSEETVDVASRYNHFRRHGSNGALSFFSRFCGSSFSFQLTPPTSSVVSPPQPKTYVCFDLPLVADFSLLPSQPLPEKGHKNLGVGWVVGHKNNVDQLGVRFQPE